MKEFGNTFNYVKPELVAQVREVVANIKQHQYSISGIYAAHNAVFKKAEKPQSCATCLMTRGNMLLRWLAAYDVWESQRPASVSVPFQAVDTEIPEGSLTVTPDVNFEGAITVTPDETVVDATVVEEGTLLRLMLEDGSILLFAPDQEDSLIGTVEKQEGGKPKAGTYALSVGDKLVVRASGKARIVPLDLN